MKKGWPGDPDHPWSRPHGGLVVLLDPVRDDPHVER